MTARRRAFLGQFPMACPFCHLPKMLDSFAGEGGVGEGYMRAGFCVDAVDTVQERLDRYPRSGCRGQFALRADAIEVILEHSHKFAVVHASPPCTGYSQGTSAIPDRVARYDRLIPAVREALEIADRPYVIENVTSKVTRAELRNPLMLCWTEFRTPGDTIDADGTPLWMRRHRLFESNVPLWGAGGCRHPRGMQCAGAYGGGRRDKWEAKHIRKGGYAPSVEVMRDLLGTPWMSEVGCKLSIPPVYTEFLGAQLIEHLRREAA